MNPEEADLTTLDAESNNGVYVLEVKAVITGYMVLSVDDRALVEKVRVNGNTIGTGAYFETECDDYEIEEQDRGRVLHLYYSDPEEAPIVADREKAYTDRNLLALALVANVADERGRAHVGWYEHGGEGWRLIYADTEFGQVSYHVPADLVPEWLPERDSDTYDGHDREEKNGRLRDYVAAWEVDDGGE